MQIKRINPSRPGSFERLAHDSGIDQFLLDLRPNVHEPLHQSLLWPRLELFLGMNYLPETERWSHYSNACCRSNSIPMSGSTRPSR